jgi:hypothetical protein
MHNVKDLKSKIEKAHFFFVHKEGTKPKQKVKNNDTK